MVLAQPEVSPYLYQFLLNQTPGAKNAKKTTAGLRPGAVKPGLFTGNTLQNTNALDHLRTIANGRAETRAASDTMYGIKLQKKQQAAAELAYKKQQEALAKKLAELARRSQQSYVPAPNLPYYPNPGPGRGGNGSVPSLPQIGNGNNGSAGSVLPPIVASGQDKRNADMNQWACDNYGQCPPGYSRRTYISAP